ncbi:hypothetical protein ENBRE01_3436 [Enteropsectra breve]|nr:hypothetical protein ENBRE01_3436 [Enteropsectra breve]
MLAIAVFLIRCCLAIREEVPFVTSEPPCCVAVKKDDILGLVSAVCSLQHQSVKWMQKYLPEEADKYSFDKDPDDEILINEDELYKAEQASQNTEKEVLSDDRGIVFTAPNPAIGPTGSSFAAEKASQEEYAEEIAMDEANVIIEGE